MFLWLACTSPDPSQKGDAPPGKIEIDSAADSALPTGETALLTGETGIEPIDPDCLEPLPRNGFVVETFPILTEEDFDFDSEGNLVCQFGSSLVGYHRNGNRHVISPNIGPDAAGIRSLPTGDFVIAQPDTGVLRLVSAATGGSVNALTGLTNPNGLEVGIDGIVYVTELSFAGSLRQVDPYLGQSRVLVGGVSVNGIGLSPDELTLYASSFQYGGNPANNGRVATLVRDDPSDEWSTPVTIFETGTMVQGMTSDKCGNLYMVDSQTGEVYRYNVGDASLDRLLSLGAEAGAGFVSSARFGAGFGGWARDELYFTDRSRIYMINAGIEGRHVLAE